MNIFKILPENFFSILNSKNRILYSKCLKNIFDNTKNEVSFSYSRSDAIIDIMHIIEKESEVDFDSVEEVTTSSLKDKANVVLRKLKETGWIIEGLNTDYTRTVFFSNYALPFIDAIDNIYENTSKSLTFVESDTDTEYSYSTKVELEGYAYTIYSLLNNTARLKKSTILLQMTENVKALLNSLKQLNYRIKSFSDNVKILPSVEDAIRDFFTEYTQEVLYKNYHKIKTLDNISKYRNKIVSTLATKLRSENYLKVVARELIASDYYETELEAIDVVKEMLHFIIDSLQNIDEIIKVIEEENYMYTNIILKKTKFMIENYDDREGQIKSIIKRLVESANDERKLDISDLYSIYPVNFIDNESLYKPRRSRVPFKQKRLELADNNIQITDQDLLNQLRKSNHTLSSINNYVKGLLSDKEIIEVEDVPLKEVSDFIYLIYMVIYSTRSDVYGIDYLDEDIDISGIRLKRFRVRGIS